MLRHKGLIALFMVALLGFAACGNEEGSGGSGEQDAAQADDAQCFEEPETTEDGLVIEDLECGDGDEAVEGKLVTVHYTGTLEDGTKFDSSKDRDQPFQFVLGAGMVIKGWDEGFEGMKIGGVRKLTIPPEMGYGEAGAGGVIPPNATLIFEVELLAVEDVSPSS